MNITASRFERMKLCPGSLCLEEGMPDRVTEAGVEGMRAHEKLAAYFRDEPCPLDEQANATDALIGSYIREAVFLMGQYATGKNHSIHVEERIESPDGYSGQPDLVVTWQDGDKHYALVFDWKSGWIEQELSAKNLQLRAYAVLAGFAYHCSEVFVALLQRGASRELVGYDALDLVKAREELRDIIREATAPGAIRTPGEIQCRYCRAIAICPEARETIPNALHIAEKGSAISLRLLLDKQKATLVARCLSGTQLSEIQERKKVAQFVFEAVEDEIKKRLTEDPKSVPGWVLKPGNKRRSITDTSGAFAAIRDRLNLGEFLGCCTLRLGELEDTLVRGSGLSRADISRILDERLKSLIEVSENSPSIVKAK